MLHGKFEKATNQPRAYVELRPLSWREKEIAELVRVHGITTATELEKVLHHEVVNASVRATLNRLVEKRVLMRLNGGARAYLYAPAQTESSLRDLALEQFASDFCGASLEPVAETLARVWTIFKSRDGSTSSDGLAGAWRLLKNRRAASGNSRAWDLQRHQALERCAADFYDGSLERIADVLLDRLQTATKRRKTRISRPQVGSNDHAVAFGEA
jgi:predicted transcriptional regulator